MLYISRKSKLTSSMKHNILKLSACMLILLASAQFATAQRQQTAAGTEQEKPALRRPAAEVKTEATPVRTPRDPKMGITVTQPSGQLVNAPGFPAYVNTGNKEKDDAAYAAAKNAWIAAHPAEYKQLKSKKK
jgi:hypothetical protein